MRMIERLERSRGKVIGYTLRGMLHDSDYKTCVPQIEAVIKREGKARLLVRLDHFHGWDLHAAWDDFVFGVRHYSDLERFAVVGERRWEKWMTKMLRPFNRAEVRYFDVSEMEDAWKWVGEGS